MILHSPILSGLRILNISLKKTPYNDFFPNFDLIEYSRCPIFIIHGDEDEEVPIDHAKILYNRCHKPYEGWWAKKAGHNNIEIVQRKDYFKKCYLFIESIKNTQSQKTEKEILESNKASDWDQTFKHFYIKFLASPLEGSILNPNSSNLIDSMSIKSVTMSNENLLSGFFLKNLNSKYF